MTALIENRRTPSTADWAIVLFGLWVVGSPFVLGFSGNVEALWNNIAVGAAIILLALANGRGGELVAGGIVVLGGWLFLSAFCLDYTNAAFLRNNVVMAFVVITARSE